MASPGSTTTQWPRLSRLFWPCTHQRHVPGCASSGSGSGMGQRAKRLLSGRSTAGVEIIGLGGGAAFVNIDGSRGSVDAPGEVDVRPVPVGSLPLAALSQIYFQTSPRSGIQPRMTAVPRMYGRAASTGHGGCAVLAETNGAARWARVRIVVAETNVPDPRGARRFRWSNPTRRLSNSGIH